MVDQPEIGTNQSYLIDTIRLSVSPKLLNPDEICNLFVKNQQSAAQIARRFDVAKSVILGILHRNGVRLGTKVGRSINPENYRNCSPPYGYKVRDGKLLPDKAELKICRVIVDLRGRRKQSLSQIAAELEQRGFKNRNGRVIWNPQTILNIFKRWNGKV